MTRTRDDDDAHDDDDRRGARALVDDSGAPNVFENDDYVEPTPENDEALTFTVRGGRASTTAMSLRATSMTSTAVDKDAPYNTHIASNHDGTSCAVATTSGRVRVYARERATGAFAHGEREIRLNASVNECEFGSAADPFSIVCACGDGTTRVYDARSQDDRPTASFRAPFNERDVASASLGGSASDFLVATAVGPHVAFYDRRQQGNASLFQDAHSEAVTRVRFHPERRSELYTSSVDGLVCAFDCAHTPLNDEESLISVMSAEAAVNNIGFCRSGSSGDARDALWCVTGVEDAHIFVASSDRRRVGVHLVHLKNARELVRAAATSSPEVSASAPEFAAQVDYVLGIHDGVAPGELFLSAGTQSGVVGIFPLVQGSPSLRGTSAYVGLGAPAAVLRRGHRDIVRSIVWDANATASESARVPATVGEDALVCAWTPDVGNEERPPVDRARPPGRRHSPY